MTQSFDDWFRKFNSWDLSHEDLIRCGYTPGDGPGDTVWVSQKGNELTRYQCTKWIEFYTAAKIGWNARGGNEQEPRT